MHHFFYELWWGAIIAYCIVLYIILDGFTLGTGIMMPFLADGEDDIAMSVILPTWDGNQTWLVLGLACLYGAFPLAFSILCPVLYLPLLFMAIFLLFRGVAFEFRLKTTTHKRAWTNLFFIVSLAVTFIQGLVLGSFITGYSVDALHHTVTSSHLVSGFSIFTAISLVFGYALLGSTRLILKTVGTIREKMYKAAPICALLLGLSILVVSIWSPFIDPHVYTRWFVEGFWAYMIPLPIITLILFLFLFYTLLKKRDNWPFWLAVLLFLCTYLGFAISLYPFIVPYKIAFWQAAAPLVTLKFTIIGACIMLPFLSVYTYYSYHIFKGKVTDVLHY